MPDHNDDELAAAATHAPRGTTILVFEDNQGLTGLIESTWRRERPSATAPRVSSRGRPALDWLARSRGHASWLNRPESCRNRSGREELITSWHARGAARCVSWVVTAHGDRSRAPSR